MVARMEHIAATEGIRLADGAMDAVLRLSLGDMRKAVTYLQSSFQLTEECNGQRIVTPALVTDISGEVV